MTFSEEKIMICFIKLLNLEFHFLIYNWKKICIHFGILWNLIIVILEHTSMLFHKLEELVNFNIDFIIYNMIIVLYQ